MSRKRLSIAEKDCLRREEYEAERKRNKYSMMGLDKRDDDRHYYVRSLKQIEEMSRDTARELQEIYDRIDWENEDKLRISSEAILEEKLLNEYIDPLTGKKVKYMKYDTSGQPSISRMIQPDLYVYMEMIKDKYEPSLGQKRNDQLNKNINELIAKKRRLVPQEILVIREDIKMAVSEIARHRKQIIECERTINANQDEIQEYNENIQNAPSQLHKEYFQEWIVFFHEVNARAKERIKNHNKEIIEWEEAILEFQQLLRDRGADPFVTM